MAKEQEINMLDLVVRVSRNCYVHENKLVSNSTATLLKRKSNGSLSDLIDDAEVEVDRLCLHNYEDGLYKIITTSHSYDTESGIVDDYDLALVPFED